MASETKKRKTIEERKAELRAQLQELDKKEMELKRIERAKVGARERRLRTRQSIILGTALLALSEKDTKAKEVLANIIAHIERPQDKETLAGIADRMRAGKPAKEPKDVPAPKQ